MRPSRRTPGESSSGRGVLCSCGLAKQRLRASCPIRLPLRSNTNTADGAARGHVHAAFGIDHQVDRKPKLSLAAAAPI